MSILRYAKEVGNAEDMATTTEKLPQYSTGLHGQHKVLNAAQSQETWPDTGCSPVPNLFVDTAPTPLNGNHRNI
jgi:hypothetical protein